MVAQNVVHPLRIPFTGLKPICDFNMGLTNTTTTTTLLTMLDPLLAATGILQQYPQHATPTYLNAVFRLRQKIRILRIECRFQFIGALSNAVLAADLYNTVRIAMYRSGVDYSIANIPYLNGVIAGTTLTNIQRVYFDKTVSLPSQAYDTTITTPTPQVRNWEVFFEPSDLWFDCYSTNATGSGAAWDTDGRDLCLEVISDSSVTPHPSVGGNIRLIYQYA